MNVLRERSVSESGYLLSEKAISHGKQEGASREMLEYPLAHHLWRTATQRVLFRVPGLPQTEVQTQSLLLSCKRGSPAARAFQFPYRVRPPQTSSRR